MVCSSCGEDSVSDEEQNGQNVRVCLECGAIDSETQEFTSDKEFVGTRITYGKGYAPKGVRSWGNNAAPPKGLTLGKALIKNIGQQIHFNGDMIEHTTDLYEKAFHDIYFLSFEEKSAMCLACLYAVARKNDHGITMKDLLNYMSMFNSSTKVGYYLRLLKERHGVILPGYGLVTNIVLILQKAGVTNNVLKVVRQLIPCMENALLTQSRHASTLAYPAAFLAWKACDYKTNCKVSFDEFCSLYHVKPTYSSRRRKTEMETAMKAMVRELPWIQQSNIKITRIEPYILDVIKYRTSMLASAIQTEVVKIKAELTANESQAPLQEGEVPEEPKHSRKRKEKHILQPALMFRKDDTYRKRKKHNDDGSISGEGEENKAVTVKKLKACLSSDSEEDEIYLGSDDDTDMYILTPEDVKQRQQLYDQMKTDIN